MRIGVTQIFVGDQERARTFYCEILGFQVKTDAPYGQDHRWLTVVSPDEPDGTELLLAPLTEPASAFQAAQRAADTPVLSLATDDCRRDYETLESRGVRFTLEPTSMPYGGIDAVFDDGCGNLIDLHQHHDGPEQSV